MSMSSNAAWTTSMSAAVTKRSSTSSESGFSSAMGRRVGEQRGRGTGHDENEETDGDQIVDCQSQQQCTKHAIRVCSCAGYRTQLYAGEMSAGSEVATAIAVSQPRRAVIDRAWRAIGPGVEVLSGDDGGPLRRTVKRILDPLVLRLRANAAVLGPVRRCRHRRGYA